MELAAVQRKPAKPADDVGRETISQPIPYARPGLAQIHRKQTVSRTVSPTLRAPTRVAHVTNGQPANICRKAVYDHRMPCIVRLRACAIDRCGCGLWCARGLRRASRQLSEGAKTFFRDEREDLLADERLTRGGSNKRAVRSI
jgi:hypothetical protein